jgi:hypothetical protein
MTNNQPHHKYIRKNKVTFGIQNIYKNKTIIFIFGIVICHLVALFHLVKLILSILNEMSEFEVSTSNGVYKVNIHIFFKI